MMRPLGWLAGALIATPAICAEPRNHDHDIKSFLGSPEQEISDLAQNIDNAIKLCGEETARAATKRTEPGKTEQLALQKGLLKFVDNPPAALRDMANSEKFGPARFARWLDPHAVIWMVINTEQPICRILVGASPWTRFIRPQLYKHIQSDNFWKIDEAEKPAGDKLLQTNFYADLPQQKNVRPMLVVSAPKEEVEGALQLNVSVSIIRIAER